MNTHNVRSRTRISQIVGGLAFIFPLFAVAADSTPALEIRLQVFLDREDASVHKVVAVGSEQAPVERLVATIPRTDELTRRSPQDAAHLATDRSGRSLIP